MFPFTLDGVTECNANNNDLQTDDFIFMIPTLNINQKIQTVILPQIQSDPVILSKGNREGKFLPDRIRYTNLVVEFKFTQDLYNFAVLSEWMQTYNKYTESDPENLRLYRDSYLAIINPIDGKSVISYIHFMNTFPTDISSTGFDPTTNGIMKFTVSFVITDYKVKINQN